MEENRITIIIPDELVGVNGDWRTVPGLAELCPAGLHALQWYPGIGGEEEYTETAAPNREIETLDAYRGALDAWAAQS